MAKKKPTGPRTVVCYHCGHHFEVSARAMTGSCPKCYGKLMIDDVVIKNTQSYKTLQTCGKLVIQARGRVIADLVTASEGIEVAGKLEAKEYRGGHVHIKHKALWKCDCRAPSVTIENGGVVAGGLFEIAEHHNVFTGDAPEKDRSSAGTSSRGRSQSPQPA
ncbi:MAG: polymer-forming cytoskeletal protein [Phycisphaerales bacterium JB043]